MRYTLSHINIVIILINIKMSSREFRINICICIHAKQIARIGSDSSKPSWWLLSDIQWHSYSFVLKISLS